MLILLRIVCAVEETRIFEDGETRIKPISIAGNLHDQHGGYLDPQYIRLSTVAEREGVRIELKGGILKKKEGDKEIKRKQEAVVDFVCDVDKTGLEPSSLKFLSYKKDDSDPEVDILSLEWLTKSACENSVVRTHWGFFTWFLIMYAFFYSIRLIRLTQFSQRISVDSIIPNIRLMAQLQSLWGPWMGPSSPWRYNPRRSIFT